MQNPLTHPAKKPRGLLEIKGFGFTERGWVRLRALLCTRCVPISIHANVDLAIINTPPPSLINLCRDRLLNNDRQRAFLKKTSLLGASFQRASFNELPSWEPPSREPPSMSFPPGSLPPESLSQRASFKRAFLQGPQGSLPPG